MTENQSTIVNSGTSDSGVRKFRRSKGDRMLAGVCGGVANLLNIDAALVRILLVAATIFGFGTGVFVYLACWLIVPEEA